MKWKIIAVMALILSLSTALAGFRSGYVNSKDVTLRTITDQPTTCRYGESSNYSQMNDFDTNGTDHKKDISLADGQYQYNVLCLDNTTDDISFTIDTSSPEIIETGPDSVDDDYAQLQVSTNEKSTCSYSKDDNSYTQFSDTESTTHTHDLFNLASGDHTYSIKCIDLAGNEALETIIFEVNLPPSFDIDIEENPPLKDGTYEVEVISSKILLNAPKLQYKYDDDTKTYDISLVGQNTRWTGFIIIPEYGKNRVGHFIIRGTDYQGLTGTKINSGELFLVDTAKPESPTSVNIDTYDEKVEIEWDYEGEKPDHYIVYRSFGSGVEPVDFYETTKSTKYIDSDVDTGTTYYYKIAAVDEANNKGEMSEEVRITVEGKKAEPVKTGLDYDLQIILNNTVADFESELFDFELTITNLEKMTRNEEVLVLNTFDILKNARRDKDSLKSTISELKKLNDMKLDKDDLDQKIDTAKTSLARLKEKMVKDIEILNSVEFQQVSTELDVKSAHDEAVLRYNLDKDALSNFTVSSRNLDADATIYTKIVNAKIDYFDGEKEYTLFSKNINTREREKNIWLIETIPKSVAEDAKDIVFSSNPRVLKNDPVVAWEYADFKSIDINYYVEGSVGMENANQVRTVLAYSPALFEEKEDNELTGNVIESPSLFSVNWKEYLLPLVGIMIIGVLLVYYFVFLKEPEEHNTIIPESVKSSVTEASPRIGKYQHILDLISHASDHADNLNMDSAKNEYMLIYELFKRLDADEDMKRNIQTKVVDVYNKIMLWEKINLMLKKAHDMAPDAMENTLNSIETLLHVTKGNTKLTGFANDYYSYFNKVKNVR